MTIAYPRDWPGTIGLTKSRFGLSVNQSIFSSDMSRDSVVQSHAAGMTDRWEGLVTTMPLIGANMAELRGLITSLRGAENTFRLGDPDMKFARSGVMPGGGFTNWLLQSEDFSAGAWSGSSAVAITTNTDGNADDIQDSSASSYGYVDQPITVPDDDATYTLSVRVKKEASAKIGRLYMVLSGGTTVTSTLRFDAFTGGIATGDPGTVTDETTYWRISVPITNNKTGSRALRVRIYPSVRATLNGANDNSLTGTLTVKEAQVERASSAATYESTMNGTSGPQVKGASQSGRSLATDGWKGSSDVLLVGDYFEVGGQLLMATEKATSDGSGNVTISFEPALRSSPADNAAIIVVEPRATVRLTNPDQSWEIDELGVGQFSLSFEEVI